MQLASEPATFRLSDSTPLDLTTNCPIKKRSLSYITVIIIMW